MSDSFQLKSLFFSSGAFETTTGIKEVLVANMYSYAGKAFFTEISQKEANEEKVTGKQFPLKV